MKQSQRGSATTLIIIIGAVFVLALTGIGVYFLYEAQQTAPLSQDKTYSSLDLGISFIYPNSWVMTTTTSEIILSNPITYSPYITLDENNTAFVLISDGEAGKTVAYWKSTSTNQWMTTGVENYGPVTYSSESKIIIGNNGQVNFDPNKSLVATPESFTKGGLPVFEGVADDTVVPLSANKFVTVLNSSATQSEEMDLLSSIEPLSTAQ
jgi:hypothetical protein